VRHMRHLAPLVAQPLLWGSCGIRWLPEDYILDVLGGEKKERRENVQTRKHEAINSPLLSPRLVD
jgi:hypothetical protein